tara:strand:+ start:474 stop:788 length:315 start_codon:yes stop_codon:yes gene_type:complete
LYYTIFYSLDADLWINCGSTPEMLSGEISDRSAKRYVFLAMNMIKKGHPKKDIWFRVKKNGKDISLAKFRHTYASNNPVVDRKTVQIMNQNFRFPSGFLYGDIQ